MSIFVSPEFEDLHHTQRRLNTFLWTSDIAYRLVDASKDSRLADGHKKARTALASIPARAWCPTNKGQPHYGGTVAGFRHDVRNNEVLIYHAVIVFWWAAFESYLGRRLKQHLGEVSKWGPLTTSLCFPKLVHSPHPVQVSSVLCADITRKIRNLCAHTDENTTLPETMNSGVVKSWRSSMENDLEKRFWEVKDIPSAVENAAKDVFGDIETRTKKLDGPERRLEAAYFYALFSFTNLRKLAMEIEQALAANA